MPIPPYHLHPILVHFPIALLLTAGFFEWAMPCVLRAQKERWLWMAAWLLWAGTVCAAMAIGSGLWAESTAPVIPSASDTVETHMKLGIAVGIVALTLSVWRALRRPPARPWPVLLYGLAWIVLLALVGLTGFYGGQLVFNFGLGVDAG